MAHNQNQIIIGESGDLQAPPELGCELTTSDLMKNDYLGWLLPPIKDKVVISPVDRAMGYEFLGLLQALKSVNTEWLHSKKYNISLLKKGYKSVVIDTKIKNQLLTWLRQNVIIKEGDKIAPFKLVTTEANELFDTVDRYTLNDNIDHMGEGYEWLCELDRKSYDPELKDIVLSDNLFLFFDLPDTPLNRFISERIIVELVARILMPGIDNKKCFVLAGDSGCGKTHYFLHMMGRTMRHWARTIKLKTFTGEKGEQRLREASLKSHIMLIDEMSDVIDFGGPNFKDLISKSETLSRKAWGTEGGMAPLRLQNIWAGAFNIDSDGSDRPLHADNITADRCLVADELKRKKDGDGGDHEEGFTERQWIKYGDHLFKLGLDKLKSYVVKNHPKWVPHTGAGESIDPLVGFNAVAAARSAVEAQIIGVPEPLKKLQREVNSKYQYAQASELEDTIVDIIKNIIKNDKLIDDISKGEVMIPDTRIKWCFYKSKFIKKIYEVSGIKPPSSAGGSRCERVLSKLGFFYDRGIRKHDGLTTSGLTPPAYIQIINMSGRGMIGEGGIYSVKKIKKLIKSADNLIKENDHLDDDMRADLRGKINSKIEDIDHMLPEGSKLLHNAVKEWWDKNVKNDPSTPSPH